MDINSSIATVSDPIDHILRGYVYDNLLCSFVVRVQTYLFVGPSSAPRSGTLVKRKKYRLTFGIVRLYVTIAIRR